MENILRENQLDAIKNRIQTELLKRGYTAPILRFEEIEAKRSNGNLIEFTTSEFQTVPVMFEKIVVDNFSTSVTREDYERTDGTTFPIIRVWIQVHLSYQHFGGGSNGCKLFDFQCILNDNDEWSNDSLKQVKIQ